ncbi:glycine betaine ABC transporter substrate-binding protein [Pseudonocardia nantongensis]|uniref:glycine betaine ABC transporter substrate-binding protein n=1 Tax=Pseudonocardia nantongensis TaxID=1181885 RepID=UPI003978A1C2
MTARRIPLLALLLATALLTAACGMSSTGPGAAPGSLARQADLSGHTYVVGSKNGDEQQLLCQITITGLQSAGASVTDRCGIGGSDVTRQALLSGDISLYWEYTGTAWASFLPGTHRLPDDQVLRELRERDLAENGIAWLRPTGFENTHAFTVDGSTSARLNLHTISDMAAYLRSGRPGTVCVEAEYSSREDGLRGLQQAYGFEIPPDRIQVLDAGLIHRSTADGVCQFGEVGTSDGRIPGLGLRVLDDDRGYHVTDNAAPTIRKDVLDQAPEVARILDTLSGALDRSTILSLNSKVSAQGRVPRDVARAWLDERGFIGGP